MTQEKRSIPSGFSLDDVTNQKNKIEKERFVRKLADGSWWVTDLPTGPGYNNGAGAGFYLDQRYISGKNKVTGEKAKKIGWESFDGWYERMSQLPEDQQPEEYLRERANIMGKPFKSKAQIKHEEAVASEAKHLREQIEFRKNQLIEEEALKSANKTMSDVTTEPVRGRPRKDTANA